MLNLAYKIGAEIATQEATASDDPAEIQSLVSKILRLKDPVEVSAPSSGPAKQPTDVTSSVSWSNKNDLSSPIG